MYVQVYVSVCAFKHVYMHANASVCVCTYQAAALLATVDPGVSAAVQYVSTLVQTLAGLSGVTLRTAEQVCLRVHTVTLSPPAEGAPVLGTK